MELAIAGERPDVVLIDYINYRGERGIRRIIPERCYLDEVSWHPGRQWILDAWDLDKDAIRSFAIADIQRWGV
jgi:predicted DNA-binding transcriptional regulator YafY